MNDRICDIAVVKRFFFTDKEQISKLIYKLYNQINFFRITRIDGHEEYFSLTNILYKQSLYDRYWNIDNYQNIYKEKYQTESH